METLPLVHIQILEIREALEVGLKKAKEVGSDLLLATDPDCDRVGVAVKEGDDYQIVSRKSDGNPSL